MSFRTIFSWTVFLILSAAALFAIWHHNWSNLFIIGATAGLSIVPLYLHKRYKILVSSKFRIGIVVFLFATLFLGEVNHFYTTYLWWDTLLHFTAGLGLTIFGLVLLKDIYTQSGVQAAPIMTPFFAFCFTGMMVVMWEVYEFIIDALGWSSVPMQASNADTMFDMIAGLVASAIVCVFGFRFLHYDEKNIAGEMVDRTQTQSSQEE